MDALPLRHSWPLFEESERFTLGTSFAIPAIALPSRGPIAIGCWSCELADDRLTWSDAVYDLFGLPHGAAVARSEVIGFYRESSRAIMERLRAYAIRHRRGFTLDAEIQPASGAARWMRLMAVPVCDGGRAVRLQGRKIDVSHLYP